MDLSERLRGWRGSAVDLAALLEEFGSPLSISDEPPSVRTVRHWRSVGVIGRSEGRGFAEREALEAIAAYVLRSRGVKLETIKTKLEERGNREIRDLIISTVGDGVGGLRPSGDSRQRAEIPVVLLAQGVMRLYEHVRAGEFVSQDDRIVPEELLDAMCELGRLYIEQGGEDRAASVHDVVERCRSPLQEWGIEAFENDFAYADALLVDPDLRVPTPECEEIARRHGGTGMDQAVEDRLHEDLRHALEDLGGDAKRIYTVVRRFLGRRSLATREELYGYCDEEGVPERLSRLLGNDFYESVHEAWLIRGKANRCAHCGTLMRPHPDTTRYGEGFCPLISCRSVNSPEAVDKLDLKDAIVCRPQILNYWVNPAIDELRIYDAAREAGVQAALYPDLDRCDVDLRGEIGIDVKSYRSPVSLAMKLNRSIGGLKGYGTGKRILAVPDFIVHRQGYRETLEDALETSDARSLQVKSVSEVLDLIGRMAHA